VGKGVIVPAGAAVAGIADGAFAVGASDVGADELGAALGTNIPPGLGVAVTTCILFCPGKEHAIVASIKAASTRIKIEGIRVICLMTSDYNGLPEDQKR
jgi:hypothetical protein